MRRLAPIRCAFSTVLLLVVCLTTTSRGFAAGTTRESSTAPTFEALVQPILKTKCYRCHGSSQPPKAELDLSSAAGIRAGGQSGAIFQPGKPDESLLLEMIQDGSMPPDQKDLLSEAEVGIIRRWIETGARFASGSGGARPISEHDVLPFLLLRCATCHGPQKREAELDLRSLAAMLKGGESGPAIVPGKPEQSLILEKIRSGQMPPRRRLVEASVKPFEPHEVELLESWIAQGARASTIEPSAEPPVHLALSAADGEFWSFQTPRAAPVPVVQHARRVRNPIDSFVLQKLEQRGLSLSPEADPLTLMRRAYFDLTGLPPTKEEVLAFEQESTRNRGGHQSALEELIDRLLESPRYGERWGRFWLDLAGYADSEGVQHDDSVRANAWRYRDYVIRAFNCDKPFDRFLIEQIAGDELADYQNAESITQEMYENLVATGFLRMAPDGTWANITNFVPNRLDVIGDEIEILSSAVLGLTFKCARCHSHKFDPISQRDYYRLLAIFKGAYDEHNWLKPYQTTRFSSGPFGTRQLPYVTTRERRQWEAHQKQIQDKIDSLNAALKDKQHDSSAAEFKQAEAQTKEEIKALEAQRQPQPMIRALWDRGQPSLTYLLRRGNYLTPGSVVSPGVPAFLSRTAPYFEVRPPRPDSKTTGRRLALAKWLVRPDHPLTARVLVNRIWKHHFDQGIVRTLDNFGKVGARPSHPELLDWLAVEFVKSGWSIKALHRRIMTSSTYRQSSEVTSLHQQLDPQNELLSRMPLRRLDAESLRDTLLLVSGRLDCRPYGPADAVETRPDGLVTSVESPAGWRRSIYVLQRRTQIPTLLENFDLPQMGPNCIQRTQSTVAHQALHLMNNNMIHGLSVDFAGRACREAGTDPADQIEWVYLTALSRRPTAEERPLTARSLSRLQSLWQAKLESESNQADTATVGQRATRKALANFCHAVMNSASFLYVD